MRCERLHCVLTEQACIRRQEDARNHNPPSICAACEQGRALAAQLGVTVTAKLSQWAKGRAAGTAAASRKGRKKPNKGTSVWSSHYDASIKEEVSDA